MSAARPSEPAAPAAGVTSSLILVHDPHCRTAAPGYRDWSADAHHTAAKTLMAIDDDRIRTTAGRLADSPADGTAFIEIGAQLRSYFDGRLTRFDVAYVTGGSDFQRRVWTTLESIPYGTTLSYGAIAEQIGAPKAAVRSVGAAIGANPLLVVRPCHRVIGASGALTGYAAGLERKQQLLDLEHIHRPA